jgi:hypothetical protein
VADIRQGPVDQGAVEAGQHTAYLFLVLLDKGVHRSTPVGLRVYHNDSRSVLFGSGFAGLGEDSRD